MLRLPALSENVLTILNSMLVKPTALQRTSYLVPIPKANAAAGPQNWRGISLMPHLTKLFDTLLLRRVRDAIDPHLHPAQNGFRPERGTWHHIAALGMLRDLAHSYHFPLHGCFLDIHKAFDSVAWSAIYAELTYWHAPPHVIRAIFSIMHGHRVIIRTREGLADPIEVCAGVLQGDTLAPYLFVLVMDRILRELPHSHGVLLSAPAPKLTRRQHTLYGDQAWQERRMAALAYADDVVLISNSAEGLQHLLRSFETTAAEVGLHLNLGPGKTERFSINTPPEIVCTADGTPIRNVASYRYLGVDILSWSEEFSRRTRLAWSALTSLRPIWTSPAPRETKRRLFRALVDPVLTYGLHLWPLTRLQLRAVDGAYGRMLRYALGLPPAFLSRDEVPSYELYADLPFLSTQLAVRRLTFFGHLARAHVSGRALHPCIELLLTDADALFKRRRPRITLQRCVLRDCEAIDVEHLRELLLDRTKCRKAAAELESRLQQSNYRERAARRLRTAWNYFSNGGPALVPDSLPYLHPRWAGGSK